MGFRYKILRDQRIILERFSGEIGLQEVVDATTELWSAEEYNRLYNGICDLSLATPRSVRIEEVRSFQDFLRDRQDSSQGSWSIVVRHPLLTALTMIYSRTTPTPVNVCSTWETACRHLSVDLSQDWAD